MGNKNRKRTAVLVILAVLAMLIYALWTTGGARADGPPPDPSVTDPYFREEAPERMVECDNNVFVPLGEGGTWECPGQQLPNEVIGRQVDCPDGSVGRIINMDLETTCEEVPGAYPSLSEPEPEMSASEPTARTTPDISPMGYAAMVAALLAVGGGTLYMIYGRSANSE